MLSVIGQVVVAFLLLAFGLLALVAGTLTPANREPHRSTWILTGIAFACGGFVVTVQAILAARAFVAGPGSHLWLEYLRWAPAWNHSRGVLVLVLGMGLALLAVVSNAWRSTSLLVATIVIPFALLVGAWIGWAEGSLVWQNHLLRLAAGNLLQMTVLASALLLHLWKDSMDRLLWTCLSVYVLQLGVGSLWTTARSWSGIVSLPSHLVLIGVGICGFSIMLALAARYTQHQRSNRYVPALLEHLRPLRIRTM